MLAVVHELKRQNIASVFVSHRLDEVMEIAERVTVLRDGRNLGTYPVRELDRRRLGELITGQAFDSKIKPPFSGTATPALLVMRSGRIVGTYDPNRISEKQLREAIYA